MAVVFATIVVVCVVLAGWVYHRRRVSDLKNEISQVQYTADPIPPPGEQTALMTSEVSCRKFPQSYRRQAKVTVVTAEISQNLGPPSSAVERNQFDNPVYAYQGCSKFDDGTTTLLNNFHFRNNLGINKNINTERAKLGMSNCTDDEDDCKGKIARSLRLQRDIGKFDQGYRRLHNLISLQARSGCSSI